VWREVFEVYSADHPFSIETKELWDEVHATLQELPVRIVIDSMNWAIWRSFWVG